jgi:hypothetical protein
VSTSRHVGCFDDPLDDPKENVLSRSILGGCGGGLKVEKRFCLVPVSAVRVNNSAAEELVFQL